MMMTKFLLGGILSIGISLACTMDASAQSTVKPGLSQTTEQVAKPKRNTTTTVRSITDIEADIAKIKKQIEEKKKIAGYDLKAINQKLEDYENELKLAKHADRTRK